MLPIPVFSQTIPKTTIFLDPATINGTAIGNTVTVNLMIRDADNIQTWGAGMIFNAALLNCTGFFEGEFLKRVEASPYWVPASINNTAGVIGLASCSLFGTDRVSGNGTLAYLNFTIKATGVSDLHLRDVDVWGGVPETAFIPVSIIDTYTVVLATTSNTVVTVSNSTGLLGAYHSGFYAHAYNPTLKELSFNVTGPYPGFCNVTIPKALLPPSSTGWKVLIDGILLNAGEITVTENATHTSLYFTYSLGIHKIRITTRMSSTISLALSSTSTILGWNITVSGNVTAENLTVRPNVNVTISYMPSGGNWSTVQVVKTGSNGNYTYLWKPRRAGTYEVMASWGGDNETLEDKSNVKTLNVRAFYFFVVEGLKVSVQTNSSISAFDFSQQLKQISFNVTTPSGIIGYSNITIPKALPLPPGPPHGPAAVITATPSPAHLNQIVTFDASSSLPGWNGTAEVPIANYTWKFGDGNVTGPITTPVITHAYTRARTYTVNLTVTCNYDPVLASLGLLSNSTQQEITVLYPVPYGPAAIITHMPSSPDVNQSVTFDASSSLPGWNGTGDVPIANYTWDFGDGNVTGPITTPVITHAYTRARTYTVNLTVTCNYDPVLASLGLLSNSTQQEITVLQPVPPTEWKIIINGTLLNTKEIILTENATHISIYFTYSKGFNTVAITNRMSSTILMALSSNSTDLGSSVTISGNITREDYTGRPNVNVTIQSKPIGATTWNTNGTVKTNLNSDYNYTWKPEVARIYEVMASWEGDNETLGNESKVQTLTVIESSTISIALSSANITFGSSVTISGNITAEDHTGRPNVSVTIKYKLISEALWTAAGQNQTDQNSRYTFVWTPTTPGTYEIEATWLGNETTQNATSSVLTLAAKWTSAISIALSSTEITKGKSVTMSGNITAADNNKRANANVAILYKPSGGEWISLANVTTNSNSTYTYTWKPKTDGTYSIMATWKGDNATFGNETEALTLTVKPAGTSILEILAVIVVVIIVIAAIAVYFIKFRKPKGKQTVS
jgi:hypothetical protein